MQTDFRFFLHDPPESESEPLEGTIQIYGALGDLWDGITDAQMSEALNELKDVEELNYKINSPGGFVEHGMGIMNMIADHGAENKTAIVDGAAYSAATLLLLPADKVVMQPGAKLMIHNPWTLTAGDYRAHASAAERLENTRQDVIELYASATHANPKHIAEWMDKEEQMNGETSVERGFADEAKKLERSPKKGKRRVKDPAQAAEDAYKAMKEMANSDMPTYARLAQSHINIQKLRAGLSPDGKRIAEISAE